MDNISHNKQIACFLRYEDIYTKIEFTKENLLKFVLNINREKAILWLSKIARILSFSNYGNFPDDQKKCIVNIFSENQIESLQKTEKLYGSAPIVFFHAQIIEALNWIILYGNNDLKSNDKLTYFKSNLLKILLFCSELWVKKAITNITPDPAQNIESEREKALQDLRRSAEANYSSYDPYKVIFRSNEMFSNLLPKHLNDFHKLFYNTTKAKYSEYQKCQFLILSFLIYPNFLKNDINKKDFLNDSNKEIFKIFFDLQSQTVVNFRYDLLEQTSNTDYIKAFFNMRYLRKKPILFTDNEIIAVPSIRLYIESILYGPLFILLNNDNEGKLFHKYGDAFEDYVCDILKRMYPKSDFLIN
jgi:hypothetical protein